MENQRKPIGYWLKHLDGLINTTFSQVFSQRGLDRRHWQVLTTLTRGPATGDDLAERLKPFWEEGEITLDEVTTELLGRTWISVADDAYTLTESGREGQAGLAEDVNKTRELLIAGMSTEDYHVTVDNLARMAANLETAIKP